MCDEPEFLSPIHALQNRLAVEGPRGLADAELLTLILDSDGDDGARLLTALGGLDELRRAGLYELAQLDLQRALACRIHAALELGRRTVDLRFDRDQPLQTAEAVYRRMRTALVTQEREELHVLGLDTQNRVIKQFVCGLGTVHQVAVDPRDVFRPLVREAAHSAIVVHNHPSGEPAPSGADEALTVRLAAAGELIGIRLLDHVIVARSGYFAFSTDGSLLPPRQ